jgi:hypothetical protein
MRPMEEEPERLHLSPAWIRDVPLRIWGLFSAHLTLMWRQIQTPVMPAA